MKIVIKSAHKSKESIKKLQKEVLDYRLHIGGAHMADWATLKPRSIKSIAIAYHKKRPIGAAIIVNTCFEGIHDDFVRADIGVFVKPKYRRKQIGFKLGERVLRYANAKYPFKTAAPKFYAKLGFAAAPNFYTCKN